MRVSGVLVSRAVIGLAGITMVGAACGGEDGESGGGLSNEVTGSVKEWEVSLDGDRAATGSVTFTITNKGTIDHEFLVVKTDIAVGEIPLVDDRFEEEADGIEVIDEIPEFPKGETKTLTVDLAPGKYQLVCNIAGHYAAGMHAAFTVE